MSLAEITLPGAVDLGTTLLLSLVFFLSFILLTGLSYLQITKLTSGLIHVFSSTKSQEIYKTVFLPYQEWLSWSLTIIVIDIIFLTVPLPNWVSVLEFPLGLLISLNVILLGVKIFKELFDNYLLGVALEEKSKINSELLSLGKFLSKALIVLSVIFLFAQTHHINLIGLVASLGVGGVAIAFASQKVLEQLLWSVVLYIDRPFTIDDYIHLPDGTLGRVESIGWRSTKIRLSGKNTLVIVPNSNLAQINIENLTGARRVILMVNLTFFQAMPDEERALVQQLILDSTRDILGIDHGLTQITFDEIMRDIDSYAVKIQVIFFILGAAETSMDLRRNLLEIARENIMNRLQEYGMIFDFEEKIIDIAQPMNI
ncbi:MAG: mechanosensitive ion channel domain-containing protein [Microcoleaceae cyanobacterium]